MEFRNIKFFLAVGVLSAQSAFAVDPPAIGPALPPGASQIASFNPGRTVEQITTAELKAQTALVSAQALEQQYQGYVADGLIDRVPVDVKQAVAQAETSLQTIQQTKQSALNSLSQYDQASNLQKLTYQETLKNSEANLQKFIDAQKAGTLTSAQRDEALRQYEAYKQLETAGEAGYKAAREKQVAEVQKRAQQDLEEAAKAADKNLQLAQARLSTANSREQEEKIKAEIEKRRLEKESADRAAFNASLMPGVSTAASLGSPTLLSNKSDRRVNDIVLRWGVCRLYRSVEGGMGGLFATIAGVIAVIFAVVGAFKAAWGFMLVAVGAFILRSLVSLFYGGDFDECGGTVSGFDANVENPVNTSGIA